jgi:hypothetical protein
MRLRRYEGKETTLGRIAFSGTRGTFRSRGTRSRRVRKELRREQHPYLCHDNGRCSVHQALVVIITNWGGGSRCLLLFFFLHLVGFPLILGPLVYGWEEFFFFFCAVGQGQLYGWLLRIREAELEKERRETSLRVGFVAWDDFYFLAYFDCLFAILFMVRVVRRVDEGSS